MINAVANSSYYVQSRKPQPNTGRKCGMVEKTVA